MDSKSSTSATRADDEDQEITRTRRDEDESGETTTTTTNEGATTTTPITFTSDHGGSIARRANTPLLPRRHTISSHTISRTTTNSSGVASQDFLMEIVAQRSAFGASLFDNDKKMSSVRSSDELTISEIQDLISAMDEPRLSQIRQLIAAMEDHVPSEDAAEEERPSPEQQLHQVGAFGVRSRRRISDGMPEVYPAGGATRNPDSFNNSLPVADGVAVVDGTVGTSSSVMEQRIREAEEHGRQTVLQHAANAQVVTPQLLTITKENTRMPSFQPELEKRFQQEHDHLFLSALVIFRPLAIVANMGFYLWDCMQPGAPLLKCFVAKVFTLAIFYPLTVMCQRYPKWLNPLGCLAMIVISTQISVSLYLVHDGFVLGAGGYGVILVPSCVGLNFYWAVGGCFGTFAIANTLAIIKEKDAIPYAGDTGYPSYYVFVHLNMFIGIYCLFSLVFSYIVEWHLRQRFEHNGTIFGWTNDPTNPSSRSVNNSTNTSNRADEHNETSIYQNAVSV